MIKTKDLVIAAATLIVSIFLIILVHSITNPIYENNLKQKQLEKINLIFPEATDFELLPIEDNFASLSIRAQVYKNDLPHGYIYEVNGSNPYGNLTFLIGVNLSNKIVKIEQLVVNQTAGYLDRVTTAVNHYQNSDITDVVDANTGSTQSVSISTINNMMRQVKLAHLEFEGLTTWKDDIFNNYEVINVEENITSKILSKETIVDNQGYVYLIQDSGLYNSFTGAEGDIIMEIAVDNEGIILGYIYTLYEHSPSFQEDVNNYLNSFIGENISAIPDVYSGPSEGSNNSKKVVHQILLALKEDLSWLKEKIYYYLLVF